MGPLEVLRSVQETPLGELVRTSTYAFPVTEALHVIAVMLVFGSIAMLDLRLIGVTFRSRLVTDLANEALPWTWVSFFVALITGAILFTGQSGAYLENNEFRIKMLLLMMAGLNMLAFHFGVWRHVQAWNSASPPPAPARIAGSLSLIFWAGVVIAGRWIGWTLTSSPF